MDKEGTLVLVGLAAAFLAFSGDAQALVDSGPPSHPVAIDPGEKLAPALDGAGTAQTPFDTAVLALEQAVRQRDFASNKRELILLQGAHDDLASTAKRLHGDRFIQTIDLMVDLDHAITRASVPLGSITTLNGDAGGAPVPSRNELAQLLAQARHLQKDAPTEHWRPDRDTLGASDPEAVDELRPTAPGTARLSSLLGFHCPPGAEAAWPHGRPAFESATGD